MPETVEKNVLNILREYPETRYDDMMLVLRYYGNCCGFNIKRMCFEDVMHNYKQYGLPCFETIRRARQRVQSLFPEYSRQIRKHENKAVKLFIEIG